MMFSQKNKMYWWLVLASALWILLNSPVWAASVRDVFVDMISPERTQIGLEFDSKAVHPKAFMTYEPNRLILDFTGTKLKISKEKINQKFSSGVVNGFNILEGDNRLRISIDLKDRVKYRLAQKENQLIIDTFIAEETILKQNKISDAKGQVRVQSIDFRRGEYGEGRLILRLDKEETGIDLEENANRIKAVIYGGSLPANLENIYDVVDFGTPVKQFQAKQEGNNVEVSLSYEGKIEKIAYQIDNEYILELIDLETAIKRNLSKNTQYTGAKLSLNFQDIEIRSVLQILSDFTGINIITTDKVTGKLTLRLANVPWDQALDMVLKAKNLSKRQSGNVMMVGTAEEIAANEQVELQAVQKAEELTPLRSEMVQINYAKADDISKILKTKENAILSDRGNVTVDTRTNTLLIQDTARKLEEVKDIIQKIDIPTKQIEIEAQVVSTTINLADRLGFKWGTSGVLNVGKTKRLGIGKSTAHASTLPSYLEDWNTRQINARPEKYNEGEYFVEDGSKAIGFGVPAWQGFVTDLGASVATPGNLNLGFALSRLPRGALLDLELQAQESEDKSKVISKPKLRTMDQVAATIESGVQVSYSEESASGGTTKKFVNATLKLEVTPQILPNDSIFLDLKIKNDKPNGANIDTQTIGTKVLLQNAETVVLGGVMKNTITDNKARTPFFSYIPVIGRLFKNKNYSKNTEELVIFITPKIIKSIL
ncbi:MAG: type IV pilus secretin PilQ [Gammaproteobacteria bacterium]